MKRDPMPPLPPWVPPEVVVKLTGPQATLVIGIATGLSQQKAGEAAWPRQLPNSAHASAHRAMKAPKVIEALAALRPLAPKPEPTEEEVRAYAALPEAFVAKHRNGPESQALKVHRVLQGIRAGLMQGEALEQAGLDDRTWKAYLEQWPELIELLLKSLEVGTHQLAMQCLEIADEVQEDKDAVAKARLRIEARTRLIAAWNRQFYGGDFAQQASHTFVINANLGGE